jgi:hypothetical protein
VNGREGSVSSNMSSVEEEDLEEGVMEVIGAGDGYEEVGGEDLGGVFVDGGLESAGKGDVDVGVQASSGIRLPRKGSSQLSGESKRNSKASPKCRDTRARLRRG